jgi:hypothetical protein
LLIEGIAGSLALGVRAHCPVPVSE